MNKKTNKNYFPILIDLSKYNTLVIGGGNIATRKVKDILEFNSSPTVLSEEFSEQLITLANSNKIKLINKKYESGDIKSYNLVFCATGDTNTDKLVYEECMESGILVNVADVPELCTFIMPATLKRGNLTISVSTQGAAPFFSGFMKKQLNILFPEYYESIAKMASDLRELMFDKNIYHKVEIRRKIIKEFLELDFRKLIEENGIEKTSRLVNDIINKHL